MTAFTKLKSQKEFHFILFVFATVIQENQVHSKGLFWRSNNKNNLYQSFEIFLQTDLNYIYHFQYCCGTKRAPLETKLQGLENAIMKVWPFISNFMPRVLSHFCWNIWYLKFILIFWVQLKSFQSDFYNCWLSKVF